MAISVTWSTKVININQADMTLINSDPLTYQLDLDFLRLELKDLEDDEEGMPFLTTHSHNPPVTVSGAVLARVIEFINGYTVTFEETGTPYQVNLVGANTNLAEVRNLGSGEVSVSSSNSAGLQDLNSLQIASFQGKVSVDTTSVFSGTQFPTGTRSRPVNNVADAITIAVQRGLTTLDIITSMTLTSADFSDGYTFRGDNRSIVTLTINSGANVTNCRFENLKIQGTLDGDNVIIDCEVLDVTQINGFIINSGLEGTVTLGGSQLAYIVNCYSGVPGGGLTQTPTINMGGTGQELLIRNYNGGIKLTNRTGTDAASLDMNSGQVIIDSTVSAGTITIRGICKVTDNSTGTAVIDTNHVVDGDYLTTSKFLALK